MIKRAATAWLLAGLLPVTGWAAGKTLPLGGADKWKYMAFAPGTPDLFIAHGDEVTVVDTDAMRVIGHLPGLSGAHGVGFDANGRVYASSSKDGAVSVFDVQSSRQLAQLTTGEDANAVVYDPPSHHVFVMNDDAGTISVIDAATDENFGTLSLAGGEGLESAVSDGQGHVFVNHSAHREVLRIDTAKTAVNAGWPLPGCVMPQGLAVNTAAHRLYISCQNSRLLVLDSGTGRVVSSLPIGPGSDSVLWDATRHRIYTTNIDGTISVVAVSGKDIYTVLPALASAPGARTGALDARSGRIYVVVADVSGADAPKVQGGTTSFRFKPGTAKLVMVDPGL